MLSYNQTKYFHKSALNEFCLKPCNPKLKFDSHFKLDFQCNHTVYMSPSSPCSKLVVTVQVFFTKLAVTTHTVYHHQTFFLKYIIISGQIHKNISCHIYKEQSLLTVSIHRSSFSSIQRIKNYSILLNKLLKSFQLPKYFAEYLSETPQESMGQ